MKKVYFYGLLLSTLSLNAQWVTLPDAAFVNYLTVNFPACMNGNQMDTTCAAVLAATDIDCSFKNIADLTGIQYFDNLDNLECHYNQLSTLPTLPLSLTRLFCAFNQLTGLPALPAGLTFLYCRYNNLTSLPVLPNSLTELACSSNAINALPALPNSLIELDCSFNSISSLPALPNGLRILSFEGNTISSIGILPDSLQELSCTQNQLNTLAVLPASLTILNCEYNLVTTLPALPGNLTELRCTGNSITVLPTSLPGTLTHLDCGSNQISSLPILPGGLTYLDCRNNGLISYLPSLPNTITQLLCGNNQISGLPVLPNALTILLCDNNNLTSIPVLPNGLTELICGGNQLSVLPALPNSLTKLIFNTNQFTISPVLPSGLKNLNCSYNSIAVLPSLPGSLTYLSCRNNLLTNLPALPNSLQYLDCAENQIDVLPALPDTLTSLICSKNLLTNLPALPKNGLRDLYCDHNQLTSLPDLPGRINTLVLSYNQIRNLPELPDTIAYFMTDYNPLNCLPQLKRIDYFDFRGTLVTCLPNYGNVTTSFPVVTSLPRCDLFNPSGCEEFPFIGIRGRAYSDEDNNCIKADTDYVYRNIKVKLWKDGSLMQQQFTGSQGAYVFEVDSFGVYSVTVDTAGLPYTVECPDSLSHSSVLSVGDSTDYAKDFDLECRPVSDYTVHSVVGRGSFRPAGFAWIYTNAGDLSGFYNLPCARGISGTITLEINGPASYVAPENGAIIPSAVAGNVITWNVADFGTADFNSDYNIVVRTDTSATLGAIICFRVTINSMAADYNPANNIFIICFTVGTSFDPNNKQVYPLSDIAVNGDRWLTYTVNFQNTGTDTALHIYLTDTLDNNLDVSTFQLLAYSHQPIVQIKENAVRFNFPNINLPDSNVNEPASHGYVQYKIKLKDNLPVGTQINNTAYIYFDFNAPVVTNTTTNTISIISAVEDNRHKTLDFRLYPNPANTAINIHVDEIGKGSKAVIRDITGRQMATIRLSTSNNVVSVKDFSPGIYLISLNSESGYNAIKKLIVE